MSSQDRLRPVDSTSQAESGALKQKSRSGQGQSIILDDVRPNDSASCASHHTDPLEEVDIPQPEKQDFVDMIRRVALKETPKEVVEQGVDPMRDMFGSSEAYKADKETKPGLPLSGHQCNCWRRFCKLLNLAI